MLFKTRKRMLREITRNQRHFYIPRFTWETWKTYKDEVSKTEKHSPGTLENYKTEVMPENILEFILKNAINLENAKIKNISDVTISVVPCGQHYADYVKKCGSSTFFSPELIHNFAKEYTDQLYDYAKEEQLTTAISEKILPIAIFLDEDQKRGHIILDADTRNGLQDYLNSIYSDADVFLPGYITTDDQLTSSTIYPLAEYYYSERKRALLGALEEQSFTNEDRRRGFTVVYVPFFVKEKISSLDFNLRDFTEKNLKYKSLIPIFEMNEKDFSHYNLNNESVIDFLETQIKTMIQKSICNQGFRNCIIPCILTSSDISTQKELLYNTIAATFS